MALKIIGDNSGNGSGISVVLKNGEIQEFKNRDGINFVAQQWSAQFLADKTHGELDVGYHNQSGTWSSVAFYPAQSYSFVRVIMSENKTNEEIKKPKRKKKNCAKGCVIFEDELDLHNQQLHEPMSCDICGHQVFGSLMLDIHKSMGAHATHQ